MFELSASASAGVPGLTCEVYFVRFFACATTSAHAIHIIQLETCDLDAYTDLYVLLKARMIKVFWCADSATLMHFSGRRSKDSLEPCYAEIQWLVEKSRSCQVRVDT